MTTKTTKLVILSLAVILSSLMSACGDAKKVYNSCGDITSCVYDTPNSYAQEFGNDLNKANDTLINVLK